ncbi:zinc ribbon domain-containing protein [Actinomadura geliboluensis]
METPSFRAGRKRGMLGHVDSPGSVGGGRCVSRFRCVACGHRANADINAARNIKDTAVGRTVAARGGRAMARPVNREPQPALLPS